MGISRLYWMIVVYGRFYWVLLGFTGFYLVFPSLQLVFRGVGLVLSQCSVLGSSVATPTAGRRRRRY